MNNSKVIVIMFCSLYALVNVSGAAIIKWHLRSKELVKIGDWLKFLFSMPVIFAFCLIFLSALIMFKTLSISSLSFTVPIATGINFIITITVGYFIFKDHLSWWSVIGYLLILLGILVLTLSDTHTTPDKLLK